MSRAWVDSGALVALAAPGDQHHGRAVAAARRHAEAGGRWVSNVLVLAEFHNLALRRCGLGAARSLVRRLLDDPAYQWLDVTVNVVTEAVPAWLQRFHDQPFSLTDAVSFELMRQERLTEAFAFDRHFVTAGFKLLE